MASPFSIASSPRLRISAENGGTRGLGRWLMAMPQYAMAQDGSVSGIAENVLIVSGKKNECSIARARSNCFCASSEHDVLKSTRPSFSPRAFASSSWAEAAGVEKTSIRPRTNGTIRWLLISCLPAWVKAAILADVGGAVMGKPKTFSLHWGSGVIEEEARAAEGAEAAPAAGPAGPLEQRRQRARRVLARDDGHDLELHEIGPLRDPALKQGHVVALHELKAAGGVGLHPAAHEREPIGHLPPVVAQPAEAPRIFTGKHAMVKPSPGSASRLCSFSRWQ